MPKMINISKGGYSIKSSGAKSVDITMYGEIVKKRPRDWWTGQLMEGDFIIEKEFLADLNAAVKGGAQKINLHLNSVGGDSLVSITIHNRIRELINDGMEFTARVDGAAMSGASMIMCACDTVEVNPSSLIMIHKCWSFIYGDYNANELRSLATTFDTYDKAAATIYTRKTGLSETVLMHMMGNTTFMTGKEAVERGFADIVLDTEQKIQIAASADRSAIYVDGRRLPLMGATAPESIPTITPSEEEAINKTLSGSDTDNVEGGSSMAKNLAELRSENPDLAKAVEEELRAAFQAEQPESNAEQLVADERQRMKEIDEISGILSAKLVNDAKYEHPCSAAELALRAMQEQAKTGNAFLNAMNDDFKASNAEKVGAAPHEEDAQLENKTPQQLMDEARKAVKSIGD